MKKVLFGAAAVALAGMALAFGPASQSSPAEARVAQPTVVELFQSQGCSDCPPAQNNLNHLADRPDVLALSYGVTYWDYLGWKDSFASPQFTQRQRDYSAHNNGAGVATPQYWINGRVTVLGANPARVAQLITAGGPKAGPDLTVRGDTLTVGAGPRPAGAADIWLVRYDPRTIDVPIRAGENGGRTIPHRDIVRQLVRLGGWSGQTQLVKVPASAVGSGLRTAFLVQMPSGGPILAALKA